MSADDPLVAELRKPHYASMSDQQAADAINSMIVAYRKPADSAAVKAHAIRNGYWADIDEACNAGDGFTRRLCRNVRGWIEDAAGKLPTLDMDAPATQAMLAGLESLSFITPSQKAELMALGDATRTWAESVGIGIIGLGAVRNARKVIAEESSSAQ